MTYIHKIKALHDTFNRNKRGAPQYVEFNAAEWTAVLDHYYKPGQKKEKTPSLTTFINSFGTIYKGAELAENLATFMHAVHLIVSEEHRFAGRGADPVPSFQAMCSEQIQPLYEKGLSKDVFTRKVNTLTQTHTRKKIVEAATQQKHDFLDTLFDHNQDVEAVTVSLRKYYFTPHTPQLLNELYQLIERAAGTCENMPQLNDPKNRYRLYAALKALNMPQTILDLEAKNTSNNPQVAAVFTALKDDTIKTARIPYFAAPEGSDPLLALVKKPEASQKFNLPAFLIANKKPLFWAVASFVMLSALTTLLVATGLIAPLALSVPGLPALFLTMASSIIPTTIFKRSKEKHSNAIAYLEAQEQAYSMPLMDDEQVKERIRSILNAQLSENDPSYTLKKVFFSEHTDESDESIVNYYNPFVSILLNPHADIHEVAERLVKMISNPIETAALFPIIKLFGGDQSSLIQYRFFAAMRIVYHDENNKTHIDQFIDLLNQNKEHPIFAGSINKPINVIKQNRSAPVLQRMQKAAYPQTAVPSKNDRLYQLAQGGQAIEHKQTQLFSKEWFAVNQKPLFYAAVAAAMVLGIASLVFTAGGASIPAAVAGMSFMNAGTLTLAISTTAGALGFGAGKYIHHNEIDVLETQLGEVQETRLIEQEAIDEFVKGPKGGIFNDYKPVGARTLTSPPPTAAAPPSP